jgi:hypothetical protein
VLAIRQTLIEIEELDPLASRATIDVERVYTLGQIGPFTEEQMPTASGAADTNRHLAK